MALEWVVLGYAAAAEAIMLLLITLPHLGGLRKGLISVVRSALKSMLSIVPFCMLLRADGYLLEVRDPADVRSGARLHADGASAIPEVDHEKPAQRPPHRLRPRPLLASLRRHQPRRQDRAAQPAPREAQASGLIPDQARIHPFLFRSHTFQIGHVLPLSLENKISPAKYAIKGSEVAQHRSIRDLPCLKILPPHITCSQILLSD